MGSGSEFFRVRIEVWCDTCVIRWTIDGRSESALDKAHFSHSTDVRLRLGETATVTVDAAPQGNDRPIERIRITVNGDLAAEARTDDDIEGRGAGRPQGLSATAVIRAEGG